MNDDTILVGLFFLAIWWLFGSIAVMSAARVRGRSGGAWFWMGIFVGPILAILCLLAYPEIEDQPSETESLSGDAS